MILASTFLAAAVVASIPKCTMVSLPTVKFIDETEGCATRTYDVEYPRCRLGDQPLEQLNQMLAQSVRKITQYDDAVVKARSRGHVTRSGCEDMPMDIGGSCRMPYQIGRTLSFQCRAVWNGERTSGIGWGITVDLGDGALRKLTLGDLLEPAARNDFWKLVRNELEKQEFAIDADDSEPVSARDPAFTLTSAGLHLDFNYRFEGHRPAIVDVPYSSLKGVLRREFVPRKPPN